MDRRRGDVREASSLCFFYRGAEEAVRSLSTGLAVDKNLAALCKVDEHVELFSEERERPSLGWLSLSDNQPVNHKGVVALPSPP